MVQVSHFGQCLTFATSRLSDRKIEAFVDNYNHCCYHESLNNLTPANVYFGSYG
jgi:transposase InsO family protein